MVCAAGTGAGPGDGTGAAGGAVAAIVWENAADGAVGDSDVRPPHETTKRDEQEMSATVQRCDGAVVRGAVVRDATAMFGILG